MPLYKTPGIIQWLIPRLLWKINNPVPTIYLTFDDGPIPGLTEYVLEVLAQFRAQATFFCVGDNVRKHPAIFQKIFDSGHSIGNHTYNHLNSWKYSSKQYLQNISNCQQLIAPYLGNHQPLFRPPYGKIRPKQVFQLSQIYKMVMWDVLSRDFDPNISPEQCLLNSVKYTSQGTIIVFHDNYKAETSLKYALPKYLAHFTDLGYQFKAI
ncbi:MAG: polysaccharide deacetylase family protein [Candidatus Cyclobacteriaceae bacterium M3_2C_046]